jgi:hypothetical protein
MDSRNDAQTNCSPIKLSHKRSKCFIMALNLQNENVNSKIRILHFNFIGSNGSNHSGLSLKLSSLNVTS